MTSQNAGYAGNATIGAGYMVIVVVGISVIPLLLNLGGSSDAPFLFNAFWRLGVALGCLFFVCAFYLPVITNLGVLRLVVRRVACWAILFAVLGNCEYLLFAWSNSFIDISVVTILYEIWPLFLIWLTAYLFRNDPRYRKLKYSSFPLLVFPFIGYLLAIASQTGELSLDFSGGLGTTAIGVVLALGAALLAPLMAFGFKWGAELSEEINGNFEQYNLSYRNLDMFCAILAFLVSSGGASIINFSAGLISGESVTTYMMLVAVVGGAVANAVGGIAWRKAQFSTDNLGVHAMAFSVPVVALIFLFSFQQAEISRVDLLVIGSAMIIVANLLINFEAEIQWSFKALILALGICGAIVYFRETIVEGWLGITNWSWSGDGYFGSIALAGTVFTLLLAFRVARLTARTTEEENRTFNLLRKLDGLVRRDVIDGEVRECIRIIDESNKQMVLKEYYISTRGYISHATPHNESDRQALSEVEAELDSLVRSKQNSPVLGEIFALLIFAGITIFLAMFTRPSEADGWIRGLIDLFAMLVSSVIVFLMIYSMDLDRERDAHKLERATEGGDYLLLFPDTERRLFDQWLSIVVGVAIILTYAGLVMHKWLGWFSA